MMKMWVQRHCYAGSPVPDPAKERSRPLLPEGIATAKAVAQGMIDAKEIPNIIFASPLVRAQQTADIIGKTLTQALMAGKVPDKAMGKMLRNGDGPPRVQVNTIDDLSPNRPLEDRILELMSHNDVKRIMIVGHVDNTTPAFSGMSDNKWDDLVMGEVRRLNIDRKSGDWKIKWCLKPSDVGMKDRDR